MDDARYYVKICGLTRREDALLAQEYGADLLGMVFHPHSKRKANVEEAVAVREAIKKPLVLVFGHDEADYILEIYEKVAGLLTFVQLPLLSEGFAKVEEILTPAKIIPTLDAASFSQMEIPKRLSSFPFFILDTPGEIGPDGKPVAGGTGKTFDWSLAKNIEQPFLLAGGLTPDNLCEALAVADPMGVDVAGGVESAPGIKDSEKLKRFIEIASRPGEHCHE